MSEEKELTKIEKLELERKATIQQINSLFLKLCIWELETQISFAEEKNELLLLRNKIEPKLEEVLTNEEE